MLEAIKNRKSVRSFLDKEVSDELLFELLEAARIAPSSGNVQDRYFIVVRDEKRKDLITKACGQLWVKTAPIIIVVVSDTEVTKDRYGERGDFYNMCNAAAAIENLLIQAVDSGLAACWVGAFYEPELRLAVDLPDRYRPIAIIPVGYEDKNATDRQPEKYDISSLTFADKFGERWETKWEGLSKEAEKTAKAMRVLARDIREKGFLATLRG